MGFLDKLLSSADKEKIMEKLQSAKELADEKVKQFTADNRPASSAPAKPETKVYAPAAGSDIKDTGSAEYFEDLIAKNLPGIEVRRGVSPVSPADPKKYYPADLVLFRDSKPVLAIIICPKNVYKRYAIVNTIAVFRNNGVGAIRFMKEFSNRPEYVIDRIKTEAKL